MRDPAGRIEFDGSWVIRRLNAPAGKGHFLHSALAARWVARGDLIAYEWLDDSTLSSPRLPFVTHPSEWAEPQFHAAAALTLRMQAEAVGEGWDLKDASAWNIVFDGLRPVFVDLLSFEPLQNKLWLAAGQFARHFLLPLVLAKHHKLEARRCMQLWRDGVPPETARKMLGPNRFLTRYWPLMAEGKGPKDANLQPHTVPGTTPARVEIQRFRAGLQQGFEWMLQGVAPVCLFTRNTPWGQYEEERAHYHEAVLEHKRQTVATWLGEIRPRWVLDVGCNAGEFSELAVAAGAKAICWDGDSLALAKLCHRQAGDVNYHPILSAVDDAPAGRGWMGTEYPGLMTRLNQQVDVVLMLAVIHHLAIAGSVRLVDVFAFAKAASARWVLVEMLSDTDERVMQLCLQYGRNAAEFTLSKQYEAALDAGLAVVKKASCNDDGTRQLALLQVQPVQAKTQPLP